MGFVVNLFIWWFANIKMGWGDERRSDVFIPFDERGGQNTQAQKDDSDYFPDDFEDFGNF